MALDTLAGVRGEMARLYRLALNGRIRSEEMTRFIYALREIRACLEAEMLTDVQRRLALLATEMAAKIKPGPIIGGERWCGLERDPGDNAATHWPQWQM